MQRGRCRRGHVWCGVWLSAASVVARTSVATAGVPAWLWRDSTRGTCTAALRSRPAGVLDSSRDTAECLSCAVLLKQQSHWLATAGWARLPLCNLAADGPGETSPERAVHPAHVEHLACSECAMAALPARHATTTRAVVVGMRCWCLTLRAPHGGIHAALPALPVCLRLSRSRLPGLFDERHARG